MRITETLVSGMSEMTSLLIYAKLFLNTIINGKSQTPLSDFFLRRTGGCTQANQLNGIIVLRVRGTVNFFPAESLPLALGLPLSFPHAQKFNMCTSFYMYTYTLHV